MHSAGASPDEVKQHFVGRYGEWILLAPRSPMAWLLPPALVLVAGAVLAAWIMRGRRRGGSHHAARPAPPVATTAATYRDRIREEVEALDA